MSTTAPLAFVDTETTGLDPHRHEIWEVALILRGTDHDDGEYLWQLPVDLAKADLIALNIGHFNERRWEHITDVVVGGFWPADGTGNGDEFTIEDWAHQFMHLTWGAHMVGAVPDFDSRRLGDLLLRHGATPAWHYHLIDVETLAAGYLRAKHRGESPDGPLDDRARLAEPPWRSDDLAAALGLPPISDEDRHTALGDARMAMAMYDTVMGTSTPAGDAADAG